MNKINSYEDLLVLEKTLESNLMDKKMQMHYSMEEFKSGLSFTSVARTVFAETFGNGETQSITSSIVKGLSKFVFSRSGVFFEFILPIVLKKVFEQVEQTQQEEDATKEKTFIQTILELIKNNFMR